MVRIKKEKTPEEIARLEKEELERLANKPKSVSRSDIAKELSALFGIPYVITGKMVKAVFDEIKDALDNGSDVDIYQFGSFTSKIKEPRIFYSYLYKKDIMSKRKNKIGVKYNTRLRQQLNDSICRRHRLDQEKYEDR